MIKNGNSTFKVNPCFKCEHGKDSPKTCRSGCEKWEKFEQDKKAIYEQRAIKAGIADAKNSLFQAQFSTVKQRKKGRSRNEDY